MNQRIYARAVEVAAALKTKKSGKSHHTAFIYKKARAVAIGVNNYNKPHRQNYRFWQIL